MLKIILSLAHIESTLSMIVKKISELYAYVDDSFKKQTGFKMEEITLDKIVTYLYAPKDSSSLAVTRILFGLAMLFDIPDERGGSAMERRWGDPRMCHFPLIPAVQAIPMPYMAIVYTFMWLGALGIMLGYKFRYSATVFALCYWYILLIEKSYWNNHSYLFGLVAILFIGTQANNCLSLDAWRLETSEKSSVPYWNYFVLKYQFFVLYFVAGLKKGTAEWLTGYSLLNLSEHWVFDPFKLFLTVSQTDYLVVHWFAFAFDLTVAFWMMWRRTRHLAMAFCAAFHLMNIRLFRIGMFPWVCLATMPLFYPFDWPKLVYRHFVKQFENATSYLRKITRVNKIIMENMSESRDLDTNCDNQTDDLKEENNEQRLPVVNSEDTQQEIDEGRGENCISTQRRVTTCMIILYVAIQMFLPYSHFITKGYNNWTNGLYGYSWDMMVHSWDTVSTVVKIVDNDSKKVFYLDPNVWVPNDRWSRHGDMVYQYAKCLKRNLMEEYDALDVVNNWKNVKKDSFKNISIYIDIWCSMNGRFQQRMFDPKVDLLQAKWSPFEEVSWLMPLLVDADDWRNILDQIRGDVHSWTNYSDVLFVADFPNYDLENYISEDLVNVTLTVLKGRVAYEPDISKILNGRSQVLNSNDQVPVPSKIFHKVHNIGKEPAYYMYTFTNKSLNKNDEAKIKEKLPIAKEFVSRLSNMAKFINLIANSLFHMFFRMPMSITNKY